MEQEFYNYETKRIFQIFLSSADGLSQSEAQSRLQKYGSNEIIIKEKPLIIKIIIYFLKTFKNPISYLLLAASFISILANKFSDALLIMVILFFNGTIQTYYDVKGEKQINTLKKLYITKSKVRRNGIIYEIDSRELVPGDILVIREGDKVTADARLIDSRNLEVDESSLTGESIPVDKEHLPIKGVHEIQDMVNIIFSGSFIVKGEGEAVIIKTGMNSYFGTIVKNIESIEKDDNYSSDIFDKLILDLSIFGVITVIFIFFLTFYKLGNFAESLVFSLAVFVAMVPEGLPASVGLGLSFVLDKLAKNKVITKNVSRIITLSSIDTICVDKTGTITENKMTVEKILIGENLYSIDENNFYLGKNQIYPLEDNYLRKFLEISVLNNNSVFFENNNEPQIQGDPTENALIVLVLKVKINPEQLRYSFNKLDEMPFSSERKARIGLFAINSSKSKGKSPEIYITGSFENIFNNSSFIIYRNKKIKIDSTKDEFYKKIKELEKKYRMIAFAFKNVNKSKRHIFEEDLTNLTFLGIALMSDPPRKNIKETIDFLKQEGTEIKMISGDSIITTENIAKNIGLITLADGPNSVISGNEFLKLSYLESSKLMENLKVFGRALPELKLKIIEILKKLNKKVLMTGDGINDVPALKSADVSFSMGFSGSEVARQVSDFVLTDDNFVNIKTAISQSRIFHQNLRKITLFLLMTNVAETLAIFYFAVFSHQIPLTPIQILWINLITDGVPIYALLNESMEEEIKNKKPEFFKNKLLLKKDYVYLSLMGLLFASIVVLLSKYYKDVQQDQLSTIIFETFIIVQIFSIFNIRYLEGRFFNKDFFNNGSLFFIFTVSILFSLLLPFTDFGQKYLNLNEIDINQITILLSIGFGFVIFGRFIRFILNRFYRE